MKFTKLSTKFNKLLKKKDKGKSLKPEKIEKLQQLLNDKKDRFQNKLEGELTAEKKESLQTKLKVVDAQLEKLKNLV